MGQLASGSKAVTAAGTPEPLSATPLPCYWVMLQAHKTNTGEVVAGGENVDAAEATRVGTLINLVDDVEHQPVLFPGPIDLSHIYIDAEENGDGVHFSYLLASEQT